MVSVSSSLPRKQGFKCLRLAAINLICPSTKSSPHVLFTSIKLVYSPSLRISLHVSNFNIWFINHEFTLYLLFLCVHLFAPGLGNSNSTASMETSLSTPTNWLVFWAPIESTVYISRCPCTMMCFNCLRVKSPDVCDLKKKQKTTDLTV